MIDSREVTVKQEILVHEDNGPGRRMLYRDSAIFSSEADGYDRATEFALAAAPLTGKSVAWIGGGFCIGPRLFAIADCRQTVYEIEPALREFCPEGVEFIPGDWRDTISGKFDIVIFDLGGDPPYAELETFLKPGGVILPRGDE